MREFVGRRGRQIVLFLGLVGLLLGGGVVGGGCTPKLQYLRADADLTYKAMKAGRVAVFSAVSFSERVRAQDVTQVQPLLIDRVYQHRGGIDVVSLDAARRGLLSVSEAEGDPVDEWAQTGTLRPETVRALSERVHARFLAFPRIDDYRVRRYDASESRDVTDSRGNVVGSEDYTLKISEGTLAGGLTIFDATTGAACWEARHTVALANQNEYREPSSLVGAVVQLVAEAAVERPLQTFPPAPAPSEIAPALFGAMVMNWPEPD